jgi:alpha-mannosidase
MQTASYASFFDLSEADGMEVLAFKQAEKGDGFILRLHDISGEEHECAIKFPKLFKKISRCDLQERVTEDIDIKKHKGEKYLFKSKPFQLHTFYLFK